MNRRQLMMLSGAAAAAGGLAQAQQAPGLNHSGSAQRAAFKALMKLSGTKSSYKIPKTEAKKTKYLDSLTTALTLTPAQRQQAETIFTNALTARAALRSNLKAARQSLKDAVKNIETGAVDQMAAAIGNLKAQLVSTGANANASLYRLLAPDQLAKLTQFQS
jgi:hypothetical protein